MDQILFDAAVIQAAMARDALVTMYIEFENGDGSPVSIPSSIERDEGRSYYDAMASDPNRDYIRVPVVATAIDSTDTSDYPAGNRVSFIAQTVDGDGVHGNTFSSANNSRVYGGALVATPDPDDPTEDRIFVRFYYEAAQQYLRTGNEQITVTHRLVFT